MQPTPTHCYLHPLAKPFLFHYKHLLLGVFREVIGLYHIEHISIAYINSLHEVIFFSYTPSIEYQLISSNIWSYDLSLQTYFYTKPNIQTWDICRPQEHLKTFRYIKEYCHQFSYGISISKPLDNIFLVHSFASKHSELTGIDPRLLTEIGQYCTQHCVHKILTKVSG